MSEVNINTPLNEAENQILDILKVETGNSKCVMIRDMIFRMGEHYKDQYPRLKKPVEHLRNLRIMDRKRSIKKLSKLQRQKIRDMEQLSALLTKYRLDQPDGFEERFYL